MTGWIISDPAIIVQAAPDSTPEKPSPKQSGLRWFIGSTQLVDLADLSIVITDQGMILQTMLSATITPGWFS